MTRHKLVKGHHIALLLVQHTWSLWVQPRSDCGGIKDGSAGGKPTRWIYLAWCTSVISYRKGECTTWHWIAVSPFAWLLLCPSASDFGTVELFDESQLVLRSILELKYACELVVS
jgi:hypothetical protein